MFEPGDGAVVGVTTANCIAESAMSSDTASEVPAAPVLSKSARKKLAKKERLEARKAERKAAEKERRRKDVENRRREWEEALAAALDEDERAKMVEARREARRERVGRRTTERWARNERLRLAAQSGQKVVVDLEFADLMAPNEIHSLVHQVMYCYAMNARCTSPAHLWLTGCHGEMQTNLLRLPGYDKWIIEKESRSYIEAFQEQKENLVYLTADAETVLEVLDPQKIYIIGGLVDRNRWKGITLKKANDQGIHSAQLPIGNYLKMTSSKVLTVNQVFEILLMFIETKDWRSAFFQVIPQRKREVGDEEGEDGRADLIISIGGEDEIEQTEDGEDAIAEDDDLLIGSEFENELESPEGYVKPVKKQRVGEAKDASIAGEGAENAAEESANIVVTGDE